SQKIKVKCRCGAPGKVKIKRSSQRQKTNGDRCKLVPCILQCMVYNDNVFRISKFYGGCMRRKSLALMRPKLNLNDNLQINIYNGIALAIATNLVNPYFAKFAMRLGATDYQLAYLNSWPAFVSIFALIPGALLIEALGNKQRSTQWIMLIHK